jgi:hypothetical protein
MGDQADNPSHPDPYDDGRLVWLILVTASIGTSALLLGSYAYAYSYDPWLTPRWTHYMMIFWGFRRPLGPVQFFLILGDAIAAYATSSIRWRLALIACITLGALAEWFGWNEMP